VDELALVVDETEGEAVILTEADKLVDDDGVSDTDMLLDVVGEEVML
jgi:hypothetical protein